VGDTPEAPVRVVLDLADGRTIPADVQYLGYNFTVKAPVWQVITSGEMGEVVRLLLMGLPESRTRMVVPRRY
jgi:hypothetical protein